MEIITGVERRRRWRCEEKLRIVAEVERPGASFNDVARGVSKTWGVTPRAGMLVGRSVRPAPPP